MPRSPSAGLTKLHKVVEQLLSTQAILDEAVFDRIDEEPENMADDKLLKALETAECDLADLAVKLDTNRRKIASAMDTVNRALVAKTEGQKVTTTPARATKTTKTSKAAAESSKPKRRKKKKKTSNKSTTGIAAAVAKAKQRAGLTGSKKTVSV